MIYAEMRCFLPAEAIREVKSFARASPSTSSKFNYFESKEGNRADLENKTWRLNLKYLNDHYSFMRMIN
jgi:hypothetical protein